jgi:hypothetical protein
MLAKKTSKNQLTLPKDVVKEFPDTEYFDVEVKGNTIVLNPVRIVPAGDRLGAVRDKIEKLGLTKADVADAVKWARKRRP